MAESVRRAFAGYDWPGNVRELRNLLDSMLILDLDGELGLDDLPEDAGVRPAAPATTAVAGPDHLVGKSLEEIERYYIERTLELTQNTARRRRRCSASASGRCTANCRTGRRAGREKGRSHAKAQRRKGR